MRALLFRGKRKDNGKWVEGAYYRQTLYYGERQERHYIITSTESLDNDLSLEYHEVFPESVGQFTGLTDKKGKKIFTGDIVKYTVFYRFSDDDLETAEEKDEDISVVKFVNGRFTPLQTKHCCEDYWYSYAFDNFRIIGNEYDNPELLKGGGK